MAVVTIPLCKNVTITEGMTTSEGHWKLGNRCFDEKLNINKK